MKTASKILYLISAICGVVTILLLIISTVIVNAALNIPKEFIQDMQLAENYEKAVPFFKMVITSIFVILILLSIPGVVLNFVAFGKTSSGNISNGLVITTLVFAILTGSILSIIASIFALITNNEQKTKRMS